MADTFLEVVNENDEVVGKALRSEIHAKGLRHREIHVWFITPDKQIIFQKRGANKDINPNLLDAAAGGHVELGKSYKQTAFEEISEETGLNITEDELYLLGKYESNKFDDATGNTNHVFREIYGCVFDGKLNDLAIEDGIGVGFKSVPLEAVYNPSPELLGEVIPGHIDPDKRYIFEALEELVS